MSPCAHIRIRGRNGCFTRRMRSRRWTWRRGYCISAGDNYLQPQPMSLRKTALGDFTGLAGGSGSGPSGTYMGNDFRAAYIPGLALNGAGQRWDCWNSTDIIPETFPATRARQGCRPSR